MYALYGVVLIAGILIGSTFFAGHGDRSHGSQENAEAAGHSQDAHGHAEAVEHSHDTHEHIDGQIWTCSMHPQIRQNEPGKCPLCAMDLIPVNASDGAENTDPEAIQLSEEAIALASVQTSIVRRGNPVKEIRLFGTIRPDERLIRSQVSHVDGRIERLLVNTVGETVRTGQTIAIIFSPDLLNAQQELIEAKKLAYIQPALLTAAREKLRLRLLSDEQIAQIEQSGTASPGLEIKANVGGIVTARRIEQGDYVNQGSVLLDLADLSSVWGVFDAYEADLPYLKVGDRVDYTLRSLPGKTFSGKISFIEPMLDATTRTAKIRVETANPRGELKPEMFADAVVNSSPQHLTNEIIIPRTAVLWTGRRSIVYVKQPGMDTPTFKLREIELGPSLGDELIALSGIREGEEIVTRGVFVVDASAQLEGKSSMMNMPN
jgi:Cu(I)/Ag(I) efflux system membrane fusion protein